jgi:hypothetical protein
VALNKKKYLSFKRSYLRRLKTPAASKENVDFVAAGTATSEERGIGYLRGINGARLSKSIWRKKRRDGHGIGGISVC